MSMNVSAQAEAQIGAFNHQNRDLRKTHEPLTFREAGLIPAKQFMWVIPEWNNYHGRPAEFLTAEHVRSKKNGGMFLSVEKTLYHNTIIRQRCPGAPKILMGYILEHDMREGQILKNASSLGIRRLQLDFSGEQIFTKPIGQSFPDFMQSKANIAEVDGHDFFRIAHFHHEHSESFGIKLPKYKNIHFFPDIVRFDQESEKVKFRATHTHLFIDDKGLKAHGSRLTPNHIWKKGDMCVFAVHESMRPKS